MVAVYYGVIVGKGWDLRSDRVGNESYGISGSKLGCQPKGSHGRLDNSNIPLSAGSEGDIRTKCGMFMCSQRYVFLAWEIFTILMYFWLMGGVCFAGKSCAALLQVAVRGGPSGTAAQYKSHICGGWLGKGLIGN